MLVLGTKLGVALVEDVKLFDLLQVFLMLGCRGSSLGGTLALLETKRVSRIWKTSQSVKLYLRQVCAAFVQRTSQLLCMRFEAAVFLFVQVELELKDVLLLADKGDDSPEF